MIFDCNHCTVIYATKIGTYLPTLSFKLVLPNCIHRAFSALYFSRLILINLSTSLDHNVATYDIIPRYCQKHWDQTLSRKQNVTWKQCEKVHKSHLSFLQISLFFHTGRASKTCSCSQYLFVSFRAFLQFVFFFFVTGSLHDVLRAAEFISDVAKVDLWSFVVWSSSSS